VSLLSIGDGDTIRVTTSTGRKVTIRLACIDAPETAQRPAGAESRAVLSSLVRSGTLQIKPQTTDRYGRTVAEVFAGGLNVNLEMVRLGTAFAYRQYLGACDRSAYLAAEAQAQGQRWGALGGRGAEAVGVPRSAPAVAALLM
jgi:endonuclease YncB( thermonuclease family)